MEDLLQVGVITQPHGVRGEVKVFPTTDDVKRFIIFFISANCFTIRFTSLMSTPAPLAILCFLDGFKISGLYK